MYSGFGACPFLGEDDVFGQYSKWVKIKLKIPKKSKQKPKVDITALRQPVVREEFALKVQNKYDYQMIESCKQNILSCIDLVHCQTWQKG